MALRAVFLYICDGSNLSDFSFTRNMCKEREVFRAFKISGQSENWAIGIHRCLVRQSMMEKKKKTKNFIAITFLSLFPSHGFIFVTCNYVYKFDFLPILNSYILFFLNQCLPPSRS